MFHAKAKIDEGKLYEASVYQQSFFELTLNVETERENAHRVASSIYESFGHEGFKYVYYAYLAEDDSYGTLLFRSLKQAYKIGHQAFDALGVEDIRLLTQMANKVSRESHLLLGLLRFVKLENGIYYAPFEPTQNVISILAQHFEERLADQVWVIHDTKRGIGAFYDKTQYHLAPLNSFESLQYARDEVAFQSLWKDYVKHIAIEARRNLPLQRQHMPKKYWQFLTEMK
nr:TIGR03915 family putative DNA repair protein [Fusibacter paucivorans]